MEADEPSFAWKVIVILGMLITGTLNTFTKKVQNDAEAVGSGGTVHKFTHPWFQTFIMFLGETICLGGLLIQRYRDRKKNARAEALGEETKKEEPIFYWIFVLPTLCDLAGTSFGGIGLLYTSASVWQMLRGSIIVFSAILSVIFLGRKLHIHHWFGLFIIVYGLCLVGVSSFITNNSNNPQLALGLLFVLLGQLMGAIQMVVEESFVKGKGFHPLNIVGMEGFFGSILMAVILVPILYFVPNNSSIGQIFHDDSIDAIIQMFNNYVLFLFVMLYLLSIAFYNFFGLTLTKITTAVHRTLIDACRTICVWGAELLCYYTIDPKFGEPWKSPQSYMQLGGFVLLVTGTLIYNEVIVIPGSTYDSKKVQASSTDQEIPHVGEDPEIEFLVSNRNKIN